MNIGIPAESRAGETRVAATPETVKKLAAGGRHAILVQSGAGVAASVPDKDFEAAGAKIVPGARDFSGADIVLKVRGPQDGEVGLFKRGAIVIGLLNPYDRATMESYAAAGLTCFAMEWLPRTTRAQAMDVLSSQANIGGYKAVILAAAEYGRFMPMLMTAAGTVKAARVLVLGAGVAGLQAIATAKRLGAVIEASDVRPAVKEQIESLGAKFLDVPYLTDEEREIAQGVGGYARPMPVDWMRRQAELVHERAKAADIVITTALIPGRTERRGDDDVGGLGALVNELRLPPHPVDRHWARVAADALRDLALLVGQIRHVEEFRAQRFDLLLHRGAHVGCLDDRSQRSEERR